MTPERWKKIEDIFQDALDLSGAERENYLAEQTANDPELRAEVEKLVARFEREDEFLESPVWTDSQVLGDTLKSRVVASLENEILPPDDDEKSFSGKKIGVYLLTEQIGRGGMGMVYAAERIDGEFSQKVAIKLIKRGMDTDFIVKRFRHERQILANLNHPNIARLLGGGTTPDGAPYFVMEFIEGKPLLKYCEENSFDLRQKLELFLKICAPVIYAHQKRIIHRDIKPSNILVTADAVPKLLDFGIAKILDADSVHDSLLPTATAMRLMTPEYASPEQVRGETLTPASDQYSLGVLLYELLTGNRPYKFPSRAPHEIARVICEEIPSEPSSGSFANTTEKDLFAGADFCRKLDAIVLKTLSKNPSERYVSTADFADDIERFLRNEAVEALNSASATAIEKQRTTRETPVLQAEETQLLPKASERRTAENSHAPRENSFAAQEKPVPATTVSPRWQGVKQGIFITALSVIMIPLFLIITVTAIIPPPMTTAIFLICFFGGFVRILYALLFEPAKAEISLPGEPEKRFAETEEASIPPVTPVGIEPEKHLTAEKTGEKTDETAAKSIAVLPFKHLNTLPNETTGNSDFLSIGLADAVITRISNIRQFLVRPTSSILKFNTIETDSIAAGKELNVRFIVEGSIVRAENRMRISVHLLDVERRSTVWAERFDERSNDFLDIEDLVSAKVVESLLPQLSNEQLGRRGTENAAAYEAYLRGRYYFNFYTDEGFQSAFEFYKKAVDLDPDYALAHAAIADYYVWTSVYDVNPVSPKAKESALRAIALDAGLSEAYAALGLATLYGEYDWRQSEENLRRAIELNPNNSVAHLWYAHCLLTQKRFEEGLREVKLALELDPLSYLNHNTHAWSFYFQRKYAEALALNDTLLKNYSQNSQAHYSRSCFLEKLGRMTEAAEAIKCAVELAPDSLYIQYGVARALAAAGKRAEVEDLIEEIKRRSEKRFFSNFQAAIAYCLLNDVEKGFEYLEKAFENHDSLLVWIAIESSFDPIRGDARYEKLLKKINHPAAG